MEEGGVGNAKDAEKRLICGEAAGYREVEANKTQRRWVIVIMRLVRVVVFVVVLEFSVPQFAAENEPPPNTEVVFVSSLRWTQQDHNSHRRCNSERNDYVA